MKKKSLSLTNGPPSVKPVLLLVEVGLRRRAAVLVRGRRRASSVLEVAVRAAVDRRSCRTSSRRSRSPADERPNSAFAPSDDDHDLLDRVEVEREGGPLAAALLAEERVVEVGAVDGDVVLDALLAVDRKLVAVGTLHDRDARRQLREVEEVAAVVREALDRRPVSMLGRALGARRLDDGRRGR